MLDAITQHLKDLPSTAVIVLLFLVFLFQIIKYVADLVYKSRTDKANQGVTHYTLYEKMGEQHSLLTTMAADLKKLENDFKQHMQQDHESLNMILTVLDGKANKPKATRKKRV